jgi:predicted amidohydrolase
MPRTIVAAAIQTAAHSRTSFAGAWPRIAERIETAAADGANLVVLPEGTLPAYVLGYERYEEAEIEAALAACREAARRLGIVIVAGAARRDADRVFNSAIAIDRDGSIAGTADNHFLWHFDRQWFAPGERIAPIPTSIGKLGALVCADGRIPTIARALVEAGAELLVMPTAWVTSGRDPQHFENAQADLLARVRAKENGVPFIAANKCGVEMHCVAYCGKSQIVAADGTLLALAPEDREQTISAALQIDARRIRRTGDFGYTFANAPSAPQRIAITAAAPRERNDDLLRILEADVLVDAQSPAVGDEVVLDPNGLVSLRLFEPAPPPVVWRTSYDAEWQVLFARARALELRIYLIVVDTAHGRAYAVDPDGAIVCGTFGEYEVASFTFDPAKTRQTAVAPGTDVLEGLRRAQQHAR